MIRSRCEKEFVRVEEERSWAREGKRVSGDPLGPAVEALPGRTAAQAERVLARPA